MLALITSHFNFANFRRPRQNLYRFNLQIFSLGFPLYGVEAFLPTQKPFTRGWKNWRQIMISEDQVMFQKESLLNVAETHVPDEYDKIAWLDADIWFQNQSWFHMTETLLDKYKVLQMFECCDFGSRDGIPFRTKHSMISRSDLKTKGQPGLAWAARRQFWRQCGGLYATAILGSGDRLAATAFMGKEEILEGSAGANVTDYRNWQRSVSAWVDREVSIVPGRLYHECHGDISNRAYRSRCDIIKHVDLTLATKLGDNKLVQWTENAPYQLKQNVHEYFIRRKEDG